MIDYNLLTLESDYRDCSRVQSYIKRWCRQHKLPFRQDKAGNITITKGTGNGPCVVAHMDTVHVVTGNGLQLRRKGNLLYAVDAKTGKPAGIGGDDKCGILAALHVLSTTNSDGMAVFTTQEELGCIGASRYDVGQIQHCDFLMQADRRGRHDAVFTAIGWPIASKAFQKAVMRYATRFDYEPCHDGSITDVQHFAHSGLGISAVNLSAGYYKPHSRFEYINIKDLHNCANLMQLLWTNLRGKQWKLNLKIKWTSTMW